MGLYNNFSFPLLSWIEINKFTETDDDGNYDLGSIAIQSSTATVFSYIK